MRREYGVNAMARNPGASRATNRSASTALGFVVEHSGPSRGNSPRTTKSANRRRV
jgi:hypothetical protein